MGERLKEPVRNKQTDGDGTLLFWAKALTALWLVALATYGFFSWSKITALDPNEVGDFLAGGFAPLAFAWLVVAVFLQREELQAQRKELEQNREALMLQAKELNASVGQLTLQTAIMREEQDRFISDIRSRSYESRIVRWALGYHTLCSSLGQCIVQVQTSPGSTIERYFFSARPDNLLALLEVNKVMALCQAIEDSLKRTIEDVQDQRCVALGTCISFSTLIGLLENLQTGAEKIVADAMTDSSELPLVTIRRLGLERILFDLRVCRLRLLQHQGLRETWPQSIGSQY